MGLLRHKSFAVYLDDDSDGDGVIVMIVDVDFDVVVAVLVADSDNKCLWENKIGQNSRAAREETTFVIWKNELKSLQMKVWLKNNFTSMKNHTKTKNIYC